MAFKFSLSRSKTGALSWQEDQGPTFHAVQIRCGADACQAAQDASAARFLCHEAPLLPLVACDRSDRCQCRYRHYSDGRSGPRRQAEGAPPSPVGASTDRRGSTGRRAEDGLDTEPPIEDRSSLVADTWYGYLRPRKD